MAGRRHIFIAGSTVAAVLVALALVLRPGRSMRPEPTMAAPARIPAAMRSIIRHKMNRHAEQLTALVASAVVLDYDGAARAAGALYDEPTIARPLVGDELNGVLPERFFALQDRLRVETKRMVEASARKEAVATADALAALARTCISCHDVYLRGDGP